MTKEKRNILIISSLVIVVLICWYLFRKIDDPGKNDPLVKRLQEQIDSVSARNVVLEEGRKSDQHIIDSVTLRSQQIQTKIIEIPKYVEIYVHSIDTFGVHQLESFFTDRYGSHP